MEVIEVRWGKDTEKKPYELWVEARSGADVLGELRSKYEPRPLTKVRQSPVDVSSPIGLFQTASSITPEENERLERCLSDLLVWVIQPQLAISPLGVILIQGGDHRPLNKLIGRLAYRFPRAELTIAVVTSDAAPSTNPPSAHLDTDWDGPIPPFHVDSIIRTYFYKRNGVRVDLFAQGLSKYPVDEVQGYVAYGVEAKLYQAQDWILKFAEGLRDRPSHTQGEVRSFPGQPRSFRSKSGASFEVVPHRKRAKITKSKSKDESNKLIESEQTVSPYLHREAVHRLSEEEVFNERCSSETSDEIRKQRLEMWMKFIESETVHDREDQKRLLDFINSTLKEHEYPKEYVYTVADLICWYGQCRDGEPYGTKR